MAKPYRKVVDDTALLSRIAVGVTEYVSKTEGYDLVKAELIEVNVDILDPSDSTKVACRITPAGAEYLENLENNTVTAINTETTPKYGIIHGAVLPEPKRRGNPNGSGAPTKYPFAELPVGGMFFSADTEHKKGSALKALASTVSAQNDKHSEPTGEKRVITRAMRDPKTHKAVLDEQGNKVTETVELDVKAYNKKFTIRAVEGGKHYGNWVAPADGALVARIK